VRYPELRVELVASDRPIELVADGFDAALHVGAVDTANSYGVAQLGRIAPVLAASRRYLERMPQLRHPCDLANPAYTIIAGSRRAKWTFVHGKAGHSVTVAPATPRALVSSKSLCAELVLAGIGLGLIHCTVAIAQPELQVLEPGGYRPSRSSRRARARPRRRRVRSRSR
jgi:DNA-binding transcriptional LysR family regulator